MSIRVHRVIDPYREQAREKLRALSGERLAEVIVDTQAGMLGRLALFLPVQEALEEWCDRKRKPAHLFWSAWELYHSVCTALTEPDFDQAFELVKDYAIRVDTHRAARQVALRRIRPQGAAVLHLTGSRRRPELEKKALDLLLQYLLWEAKKIRELPRVWAGLDQHAGKEDSLSDAEQERVLYLLEVLASKGDRVLTDRLARAINQEDDYAPNEAARDFFNRLTTYCHREELAPEESIPRDKEGHSAEEENSMEALGERIRRRIDPDRWGIDPNVWTPEAVREAQGEPPARSRLVNLVMNLPQDFQDSLPPQELKAFEALRKAVLEGTLSSEGGVGSQIAEKADVSPATVTRLIKKIRTSR